MLRFVRAAIRLITDRGYRSVCLLRWRRPKNLFQASSVTASDRYPALFRRAQDVLGGSLPLRILSFGCSTGEEVFTLRSYFPHAWIKGIDINPHNIVVCQRRLAESPDPQITFELADSVAREPIAAYDAIFCMAVFRRGDLAHTRYSRCDKFIRFEDFCRIVDEITSRLKPGGLLSIIHANFRFRDTPRSAAFDLIFRMDTAPQGRQVTPIFDRHNCRTTEVNHDEVIFRKKVNPHEHSQS